MVSEKQTSPPAPFLEKARSIAARYEHHLSTGAFLAGFLIDSLTLTRIDFWVNHAIIFTYLAIAVASMILLQAAEGRKLRSSFFFRAASFLPIVIQFAFGALFSVLFVYYARSASFAGNWFFILLLGAISVGNEFVRGRYARLEFQFAALFAILFAFMIFYVPIVLDALGAMTFLLGGFLSLCFMIGLLFALYRVAPSVVEKSARGVALLVGGLYFLLNVLYFTNIIPPIPLSLRGADVYHLVTKEADGSYVGFAEERSVFGGRTYHHISGEPVYFYSAIFAPTKIALSIYHEWQFYDERRGEWVTKSTISFPVIGGREKGYRGYSLKQWVEPGEWRVLVKTRQGQLLGQRNFLILSGAPPSPLRTRVLE